MGEMALLPFKRVPVLVAIPMPGGVGPPFGWYSAMEANALVFTLNPTRPVAVATGVHGLLAGPSHNTHVALGCVASPVGDAWCPPWVGLPPLAPAPGPAQARTHCLWPPLPHGATCLPPPMLVAVGAPCPPGLACALRVAWHPAWASLPCLPCSPANLVQQWCPPAPGAGLVSWCGHCGCRGAPTKT